MKSKKITPKYSPEVRERAVRMVQEHRSEYPSLWAAIESIAPKIGCVPQTLHEWVRKYEIDTGMRDGGSKWGDFKMGSDSISGTTYKENWE